MHNNEMLSLIEKRNKEFKKYSEELQELEYEENEVKCKKCDFNYCHIQKMIYYMPLDSCKSQAHAILGHDLRIVFQEEKVGFRIREGAIDMHFICEDCQHEWIETFAFHKGQIFHAKKNKNRKLRND